MSAQAYPLTWPIGRKRWSGFRARAAFKMSDSDKVAHLHDELDRLNARDIVISTNRPPYSRAKQISDPGVAVYFTRKGKELCIACDKWDKVEDNLHAVGLAIQAMRGLERWGTGDMVDAAFTGFTALPESIIMGPGTARNWWEVLQVSPDADFDIIEAAYKRLLHKAHPDKGGNATTFMELQEAFKQAKEARS